MNTWFKMCKPAVTDNFLQQKKLETKRPTLQNFKIENRLNDLHPFEVYYSRETGLARHIWFLALNQLVIKWLLNSKE